MKFLIQHNLINPKHLLSIKEAIQNYPYEFVGLIPFSHEVTSNEPLVGKNFIPYGSTSFVEVALRERWAGLAFDPNTANYEAYLANRNDMLNDCVMRLDEGLNFLNNYQNDRLWFVKPSKDLKEFTGEVATTKEWKEVLADRMQCASSGSYKLEPDTMIVISKPKEILAEYRWFIINRKVVSGSMYRSNNVLYSKEQLDTSVIQEAQLFANKWLPHDNVVMDLALTEDGMKVIEFNCINASGFYGCNIKKIFNALWNYYNKDIGVQYDTAF